MKTYALVSLILWAPLTLALALAACHFVSPARPVPAIAVPDPPPPVPGPGGELVISRRRPDGSLEERHRLDVTPSRDPARPFPGKDGLPPGEYRLDFLPNDLCPDRTTRSWRMQIERPR